MVICYDNEEVEEEVRDTLPNRWTVESFFSIHGAEAEVTVAHVQNIYHHSQVVVLFDLDINDTGNRDQQWDSKELWTRSQQQTVVVTSCKGENEPRLVIGQNAVHGITVMAIIEQIINSLSQEVQGVQKNVGPVLQEQ